MELNQRIVALLRRPVVCFLTTLMADGSPQVTLVWVDCDGTDVLVNTVEGYVKLRNMERDPRVALAISDPEDPSSYVAIRGRVVETTTEGGWDHIDMLALRYTGGPYVFTPRDTVRVIVRIRPEHVTGHPALVG